MVTAYQKSIMDAAHIEYTDINDDDVITWELVFAKGLGVRGWYYLYGPDGFLKDLKYGMPIPLSECKQKRAPIAAKIRMLQELKNYKDSHPIEPKAKTVAKPTIVALPQKVEESPVKTKKKRNLSAEERQRRSQRCSENIKKYWANKKAEMKK